MTCKQWMKRGALAAVLSVLGAMPVMAQNVEAIMRARERLELTEQQVQQLDAIRRETVAQRSAEQAQLAELRSQLAAGQIRQSEVMAAMEDRRDALQARAEERRASIEAILTEAQRESLDQMRRRVDRQRPGVGRARPGVGRGAPGFRPRQRIGFAPEGRRPLDEGPRGSRDFDPPAGTGLR